MSEQSTQTDRTMFPIERLAAPEQRDPHMYIQDGRAPEAQFARGYAAMGEQSRSGAPGLSDAEVEARFSQITEHAEMDRLHDLTRSAALAARRPEATVVPPRVVQAGRPGVFSTDGVNMNISPYDNDHNHEQHRRDVHPEMPDARHATDDVMVMRAWAMDGRVEDVRELAAVADGGYLEALGAGSQN